MALLAVRSNSEINIGMPERVLSLIGGGLLLMNGLQRRSLLGWTEAAVGSELVYRSLSGHCHVYGTLGINTDHVETYEGASPDAPEVERAITIGKSADELYRFWRNPENHQQILGDWARIKNIDEKRSHWVIRGPWHQTYTWDSMIVEDRPGEFIRWRSLAGAELPNEGSIQFQPAPDTRGTEAKLRFRFDPPAGLLGRAAAKKLDVVTRALASKALRRFKSLLETGEIPTLQDNPSARVTGQSW